MRRESGRHNGTDYPLPMIPMRNLENGKHRGQAHIMSFEEFREIRRLLGSGVPRRMVARATGARISSVLRAPWATRAGRASGGGRR